MDIRTKVIENLTYEGNFEVLTKYTENFGVYSLLNVNGAYIGRMQSVTNVGRQPTYNDFIEAGLTEFVKNEMVNVNRIELQDLKDEVVEVINEFYRMAWQDAIICMEEEMEAQLENN